MSTLLLSTFISTSLHISGQLQVCAHHQENFLYLRDTGIFRTLSSPDDGRIVARNMQRS